MSTNKTIPSLNMDNCVRNPADIFHDLFICMIDFEPLRQPKLLQCGHSFCRVCLLELQASQRRSSRDLLSDDDPGAEQLKCPVCSRFTILPEKGVDGLSDNFILEKVKDCVKELEKSKDESMAPSALSPQICFCEMSSACKASKTPAQFRCHDCSKNCCIDCHKKHDLRLNFHKTMSLSSDVATLLQCPDHEGEYIMFYCLDCKVSLCTMCCVNDEHDSGHVIVEITDKENILQERHYIGEHLNQVKETLNHVNVLSNKLSDLRMCLYDMYAKCEEEMQQAFTCIIQEVQNTWAKYESERQASKIAAEKLLDIAQEEINFHITNCSSLIQFVDRLLSNNVSFQPLTLFRDLSARMTLAVKDIPALNVLVPELHVTHLVPEEPSTITFGYIVDSVLEPSFTGKEVELRHVSDKNGSQDGGFFMPELDDTTKVPEVTVSLVEAPLLPPRRVKNKVGKSKFYSDGGGIFLEEGDALHQKEQLLSITRKSSTSSASGFDEVFPISPSPFSAARQSYAYSSDPLDMHNFRRCVSNISLSTTKQKSDFAKHQLSPVQGTWHKKSLFQAIKSKLSSPKVKKVKEKKVKEDKVAKSEKKVHRLVSTTSTASLMSVDDASKPPPKKPYGTRMWHVSCSSSGPDAPLTYPSDVAICAATAEVYIVDNMQARIAVLQAGSLTRFIKPTLLPRFNPWGVAVSAKGYVYCTDMDNRCIQVFSCQGHHLTAWQSLEDHVPYGIDMSQDGTQIVVTSASQQSPPSNILVNTYNEQGTIIHSFRCTYGGGHGELKDPRYVHLDSDSNVLIADGDTGYIQKYTISGRYLGHFERRLGRPAGLCTGSSEDILVADRGANNRMVHFSNSGQFLGELDLDSTSEVNWPQSLASKVVGDPVKVRLLAVTEYLANSKVTVGLYFCPHKEGSEELDIDPKYF